MKISTYSALQFAKVQTSTQQVVRQQSKMVRANAAAAMQNASKVVANRVAASKVPGNRIDVIA
ncbi:MAG: hypothetical protein HQL66_07430 [Magnetococcales bacterium]|nr:hypothetical protein [Magnetococcales bacterium]